MTVVNNTHINVVLAENCGEVVAMNNVTSPETRRIASAAVNGQRSQLHPVTATGWAISPAGSLPVLCKPDVAENRQVSNGSMVISMRNEIDGLRKELNKNKEIIGKMQDREKQLRERFHFYSFFYC